MTLRVIIIGAGPAGLTAALELCEHSVIRPIVLEALDDVGGISRTVEYKGHRMDIGGHRFFSKSDWVMDWWRKRLPEATTPSGGDAMGYVPDADAVMLHRSRLSRIYFLRRFFDYPVTLSATTMRNLGLWRLVKIGVTYFQARLFPRRPERNLQDFFINRFGQSLYRTFFKDYTEKVWGVSCDKISSAWGAQRIKGLSILEALRHALGRVFRRTASGSLAQKHVATSLIDRFLYPKYGPGQMWRKAADELRADGGQIRHGLQVTTVELGGGRVQAVRARNLATGEETRFECDWLISTMPVKDLIASIEPPAPAAVAEVADGLMYRDFITVGVLLHRLKPNAYSLPGSTTNMVPDTWIYIQEPDVKLGRLQVFNNWSPALVPNPDTVWLGLEYFCQEGDELWNMPDERMGQFAIEELAKIGLIDKEDALDFNVVHVPKAYPAYFGSYDRFDTIRAFTDTVPNLFLVGRNGMHRYNNQDHSMLTAKAAAECIISGNTDKAEIWDINLDDEYHEEKKSV